MYSRNKGEIEEKMSSISVQKIKETNMCLFSWLKQRIFFKEKNHFFNYFATSHEIEPFL